MNDQPIIETTIFDYIEVNGRISKKLVQKVIIPMLNELAELRKFKKEAVDLLDKSARGLGYYGEKPSVDEILSFMQKWEER